MKRKNPQAASGPGLIEIEDEHGNRVTVTEAHWRRWPSVRETFRPVADQQATPVAEVEPPTGDNETEK